MLRSRADVKETNPPKPQPDEVPRSWGGGLRAAGWPRKHACRGHGPCPAKSQGCLGGLRWGRRRPKGLAVEEFSLPLLKGRGERDLAAPRCRDGAGGSTPGRSGGCACSSFPAARAPGCEGPAGPAAPHSQRRGSVTQPSAAMAPWGTWRAPGVAGQDPTAPPAWRPPPGARVERGDQCS